MVLLQTDISMGTHYIPSVFLYETTDEGWLGFSIRVGFLTYYQHYNNSVPWCGGQYFNNTMDTDK